LGEGIEYDGSVEIEIDVLEDTVEVLDRPLYATARASEMSLILSLTERKPPFAF
jgi:hypothetical protein